MTEADKWSADSNMHQPSAQFSLFTTPIGDCGVAWRGELIVATRLPDKTPEATIAGLVSRTAATKGEPGPAVRRVIEAMVALLEGEQTDLSFIACDFSGIDPFSLKVVGITRSIPAGATTTYGAIAQKLGDKQRAREVGQALGRNPFPVIVPCHRVVGANGRLTGFSAAGGIQTKLKMLAIEKARIGEEPGLFPELPMATKQHRW